MARVKTTDEPVQQPTETPAAVNEPRFSAGLPKPPGQKLGAEAFFEYIKSLDEQRDWPHLVCYVYRFWPVLNEKGYIDKISMPFDAEYIIREHGSGTYRFTLNDQNIRAKFRTVCYLNDWVVRDLERPPVIPDLTKLSLNDPANKDYVAKLIREGKLDPQGNIPAPAATGTDPNLSQTVREAMNMLLKAHLDRGNAPRNGSDASEALEKGMAMLEKAHARSMDMLQRQNDPSGALQLLQAIKELMPKPEPQSNPANLLKEIVGLVRELVPQPSVATSPQQSVAGQLKELIDVMGAVREMAGVAEPIRASKLTWPDVIMNAVPMIPGILSQAASLFWAARATAAPSPTGATGRPPNPAVSMPPASAPDGTPAAATRAIEPPAADPFANDPHVAQLAQFIPVIAQPLVNALNTGQSGADFADWIAGGYGQTVYGAIAQMQPEQIRAALDRTEAVAQIVQSLPHGALDQFIAEFLHPELAAEDDEQAPRATAAGGVQ